MKYILCIAYALFSVLGLTLVKLGSDNQGILIPIINMNISLVSLMGLICYGVSFFLYMGVISKFDLGIIIPILGGIVNILILLVSFFILKEKLTINTVVGAIVIIIGIVIMNLKN